MIALFLARPLNGGDNLMSAFGILQTLLRILNLNRLSRNPLRQGGGDEIV